MEKPYSACEKLPSNRASVDKIEGEGDKRKNLEKMVQEDERRKGTKSEVQNGKRKQP